MEQSNAEVTEPMRRLLIICIKKQSAQLKDLLRDIRISKNGNSSMIPIRRAAQLLYQEAGDKDWARKTVKLFGRAQEQLEILGGFELMPCPTSFNNGRVYEYATFEQMVLFLSHIAPARISVLRGMPGRSLPGEAAQLVADVLNRCPNVGKRLSDLVEQAIYEAGMLCALFRCEYTAHAPSGCAAGPVLFGRSDRQQSLPPSMYYTSICINPPTII